MLLLLLLFLCREVQLAALLLYNAKLGQESKCYPWIQALPTKFDTLTQWTAAELDELQLGTTTTELGFRSEVRPFLCSFFGALSQSTPPCKPGLLSLCPCHL